VPLGETNRIWHSVVGGELLSGALIKSLSTYVGLVLMFFGSRARVMGFGDAVNASGGTSIAI
jgi:hypothetical protein